MKKHSKDPAQNKAGELFAEYIRTRTISARNSLILQYAHLPNAAAEALAKKLPSQAPNVEELASAALDGLIDAIESFDPASGVKFETFAYHRIRGAILDEIRALDPIPRLVRDRAAKLLRIESRFALDYQRRPTDAELQTLAGFNGDGDGFRRWLHDARAKTVTVHISAPARDDSRNAGKKLEYDLVDHSVPSPSERLEQSDIIQAMMRGLTLKERNYCELYFLEGVTMAQIGEHFGKSESRISQIIKTVAERLLERYPKYRLTDDSENEASGIGPDQVDQIPLEDMGKKRDSQDSGSDLDDQNDWSDSPFTYYT